MTEEAMAVPSEALEEESIGLHTIDESMEVLPGPTQNRRTVITTTVERREEVLMRFGIDPGWRLVPLKPKHDAEHRGERWVPVDELRSRKGKRYYRMLHGHGDWDDIPVDVEL